MKSSLEKPIAESLDAGIAMSPSNSAVSASAKLRAPSIEQSMLLERCLGQHQFMMLLLEEFAASLPGRMTEISALVARGGDCRELARAVHAFKGSVAVMAATTLKDLAVELETAITAGAANDIAAVTKRLEEEAVDCQTEIPQLLAECERHLSASLSSC